MSAISGQTLQEITNHPSQDSSCCLQSLIRLIRNIVERVFVFVQSILSSCFSPCFGGRAEPAPILPGYDLNHLAREFYTTRERVLIPLMERHGSIQEIARIYGRAVLEEAYNARANDSFRRGMYGVTLVSDRDLRALGLVPTYPPIPVQTETYH